MHVPVHVCPFLIIFTWQHVLSVFRGNACPLRQSVLLLCVPALCPGCAAWCVCRAVAFQLHVHRNASAPWLGIMSSLSIPPSRLCGGNLEMLQGRALELDSTCQEISTKDRCKRPWARPLSEEHGLNCPGEGRSRLCPPQFPAADGGLHCERLLARGTFCTGLWRVAVSPNPAVPISRLMKRCTRTATLHP